MPQNDSRSVAPFLTRREILGSSAVVIGLSACPSLARSTTGAQVPLWVARKNGRNIYILGESLPRSTNWHQPDVEALLRRCGHLWTETNQVYRKPANALVKSYGMAPSQSVDLLSAGQRSRLNEALAATGLSLNDLAGARPWLIGATLEDAGYRTYGLTGKSANTVLSEQAAGGGIPVTSEFPVKDDVFAWFGAMTPVEETQFLSFCVDGVLLGRSGMETISQGWLSGDSKPAASFVSHERRDYPQLYSKLTASRNVAWLPRFEEMLRDPTPTLVVVGLYHLVGPDSLLAQLRRANFAVSKGVDTATPPNN